MAAQVGATRHVSAQLRSHNARRETTTMLTRARKASVPRPAADPDRRPRRRGGRRRVREARTCAYVQVRKRSTEESMNLPQQTTARLQVQLERHPHEADPRFVRSPPRAPPLPMPSPEGCRGGTLSASPQLTRPKPTPGGKIAWARGRKKALLTVAGTTYHTIENDSTCTYGCKEQRGGAKHVQSSLE